MGAGRGENSVLSMIMTAAPHGATGNEAVIETAGLTKRFRDRIAVAGLDLRVPGGRAYGLLGPNGAGKTTLIRMVLGLTSATAGTGRLLGMPMPAAPSQAA